MQEGGTYIIPGHGRVSDEADLAEVRDQVHMIRDRFFELAVPRNMTLPQVMAMKPLIDFERRYDRPEWTAEQFAAAVYAEMVTRRSAAAGQTTSSASPDCLWPCHDGRHEPQTVRSEPLGGP